MKHGLVSIAIAIHGFGCAAPELSTATSHAVVADFSSGVPAANAPAGAGQYGVWYDTTDNTFGTPTAASLGGAPAMRIDDGGFVNGVYAIYAGAVPASGTYKLQVTMQVVETTATTTNGVDAYRVGVAVGAQAVHRATATPLAGTAISGAYAGLTDGEDTAVGPQVVTTGDFTAAAGDDVLIAFGTDVSTGAWNQASQTWNGTYVLVGAIELVPVVVVPSNIVDNGDGAPAYVEAGAWATGGATGHAGTYRFTSAGNAASARFTKTLEPGFYDVETIYRAGTNRAAFAAYSVEVGGAVALSTTVDQRFGDLVWSPLGLIEVTTTGEVTVTLDAGASAPAGQVVIADAVRFQPSAGPPPIDPAEMRIAAITVFDPIGDAGAIQSTVQRLVRLHYNAIAIHTRFRGDATYFPNRADATYPNSEPRNPQAGNVDVLDEYVTRGHAAGMKVFAYVNTHLVTDGDDTAASPAHVLNTHPEWRTYAYNGGTPVVQTVAHDPEGAWLEPALPAVRGYLVDVISDIAANYDIDGVILDRIRYPQTSFTRANRDFGYHPDAIAAFNAKTGKTGVPDPTDADWIAFRQQQITRTVTEIYDRLAAIDPQLLLLAYPLGRFTDATQFAYQDWPTWMRDNAIDAVLPQIYTTDNAAFSTRLDEHRAAYGGDRLLGVTLNAFQPNVDLAAQIELARTDFDGSSPFRHGVMDGLGYNEDLAVAWDGIAPWPETPWKGVPVVDLALQRSCPNPAPSTRRWRVDNPNAWSVEVAWWVLGTQQQGGYFAAPGSTTFDTTSVGLDIVIVAWRDHLRQPRLRIQIGLGAFCW
jgi:uncharacterized lipoprotein YddW (UPF0748 family)